MLSIPELASQIVNKSLSENSENTSRTIFLVGSKSVGKSTLLSSLLEKNEVPRETLVLEYSFGRKSINKQSIEKTICHVWEYGGKLDILLDVLSSVPARGQSYFCIMIDLSKIKSIWNIIETCISAKNGAHTECGNTPELILIGGKYDIFKNYDNEIKKIVCTTLRCVALANNAHLIFYSSKESQLAKRAKEILYSVGFGNEFHTKEKNTNFAKPLLIPRGSDSWENIGVQQMTMNQIKARHLSRIAPEVEAAAEESAAKPQLTHPESVLDALASAKYEELRSITYNASVNDYLLTL